MRAALPPLPGTPLPHHQRRSHHLYGGNQIRQNDPGTSGDPRRRRLHLSLSRPIVVSQRSPLPTALQKERGEIVSSVVSVRFESKLPQEYGSIIFCSSRFYSGVFSPPCRPEAPWPAEDRIHERHTIDSVVSGILSRRNGKQAAVTKLPDRTFPVNRHSSEDVSYTCLTTR